MNISRKTFAHFVLLGFLVFAMLFPFAAVRAEGNCDQVIVDEVGLFNGNVGDVQAAVSNLENVGATVRVRTMQNFGSAASLEQYFHNTVNQCASWQSADGGTKNNLVVFMVSLDGHDTGVFSGDQWGDVIDNNWVRITTDFMNPRFKDGDFVGGFVAGMNETARLFDLKIHPQQQPVAPNSGPVVVVQQPASEPVDLSGFWRVLGWLVFLGFLGAATIFGISLYATWSKEQAKKRGARQKALLKKQAVSGGIAAWSQKIQDLQTDLLGLKDLVDPAATKPIQDLISTAEQLFSSVLQQYQGLDRSAGDPSALNLSVDEYTAIESAYNKPLALLEKAEGILSKAASDYGTLKGSVSSAPKVIEAAEQEKAKAAAAVQVARTSGFRVPEDILSSVEKLIANSRESVAGKRPDLAVKKATDATLQAQQVSKDMRALPVRKSALEQTLVKIATRIEQAKQIVTLGRQAFDDIDNIFPEDAWESVHGNGTEAENRVNKSREAVELCRKYMVQQDYSKAEDLTQKVNDWLDEVSSLMRSVIALKKSLFEAQAEMKTEVELAEKDVVKALEYIRDHKSDIGADVLQQLRGAQDLLKRATAELSESKPNPLIVVKLARQANEAADAVLVEAREDVDQLERLRAKQKTSLREAAAAYSKAKEYIEDHSSDVNRTARDYLEKSQALLVNAKNSSDLAASIKYAEAAEEMADRAYSKAKSDYNDAVEARRPTPSSYDWGSSSSSSSSHSSWSAPSSSSSHGGSSSWGSSSSHGGSSSFGGSSGSHGGSSKW